MATLNLVEYGSDDDDFAPAPATKPNPQKAQTDKPAGSAQPQKATDSKDSGAKRVIKYSSLQTSKNLLDKNPEDDKAEEWKPTSVDFSKKNDPNQAPAEKPAFKPKKGNSYAVSFLTNLPKPKKELKNVSKGLMISDSYSYDKDDTDEVITKKVKLDRGVEEDYDDEEEHPRVGSEVPHYSSLKKKEAANLTAFTEEDRQIVSQNDKSNKIGLQGDSGMIEINANSLADPNWERNVEKSLADRMTDPRYKLAQPSKTAKGKNQLVALAYDNMSKNPDEPSGKKEANDAKKRTHNRYGW